MLLDLQPLLTPERQGARSTGTVGDTVQATPTRFGSSRLLLDLRTAGAGVVRASTHRRLRVAPTVLAPCVHYGTGRWLRVRCWSTRDEEEALALLLAAYYLEERDR